MMLRKCDSFGTYPEKNTMSQPQESSRVMSTTESRCLSLDHAIREIQRQLEAENQRL